MLTVIAILGILAALLVPALKNFGHADAMTAATRQILDDVGRTRQLAISHHTTVYMVFVPTSFWNDASGNFNNAWWNNLNAAQKTAARNLCDKQLTGYTFVSLRTVGDQPGQGKPHYIAPWRNLPDGTFIAQQKFVSAYTITDPINSSRTFSISPFNYTDVIPFPTEDSPPYTTELPCIAFNYLGQLTTNGVDAVTSHEYIPLARGSVSPAIDPATKAYRLNPPATDPPDISEIPSGNSVNTYNIIDIEPLTGRATLQQPKVK
jgi:type II secretory pathway pseudopilin PulG